jgi:predicted ATPase/DNA-binding SARP family transcriptional activator/DNA-binding CsgD family transcriptional regulator
MLGGFSVSVGLRDIQEGRWRLRKAASLVKLIALAPNHRMHRERIMDLLWPHMDKKAAANSLSQALHAARRTLDPGLGATSLYLASHGGQLVLCPGGQLWVDVNAFEEAAATACRTREPSAYRAALDLYAGELLPGDLYEDWTEARREGLRQILVSLLVDLSALYEQRGEYDAAIGALQKAVAEEPTREEMHRNLMRLHLLSGQRGAALTQYEQLKEILSRELDAEPETQSRLLREEIRSGQFPPTHPPGEDGPLTVEPLDDGRHNLPPARTSFVGREREVLEIKRGLSMGRLLTLTGAGGSGKTRLALEVAKDLAGAYRDGVWLVELAPIAEPPLLSQAVASVLEVSETPDRSLTDTIVDDLREKNTLLILDNCEHLLDAVARLADTLLDSCPHLRILATSRESLAITGERNWSLASLSLPDSQEQPTVGELERYESVRLFVERAQYRNPTFALTPGNAGAVAKVCQRLEGIPLAIELAATRVGPLSVEQISERLKDSLKLLRGGSRTATPRQQTLRGAMDWSYELLSEPEQELFRRLSVFAGGWTLEAAEAVGPGGNVEIEDVLDLLFKLVDKSLVVAETGRGGAARYRMLEPIRQYARVRLEESEKADTTRDRHAAFFLALAKEAEPELSGPQQSLWVERLESEHDNLRAALSWLLEGGEGERGLLFSAALWRFWYARGYVSEGLRWLEEALAVSDLEPTLAHVKALEGMGWLVQRQGDSERTKATYEEMLKLSQELGDKGNIATALNSLAIHAVAQGDNERATALLEENLSVLRELENEQNTATTLKKFHVLGLLGILAANKDGDYGRAEALWEESLTLAREVGDSNRIGTTLCNLGYIALLQGDHERAVALSEEALAFARELGSAGVELTPETLVNLGLAVQGQGDHEHAMACFKEALVRSHNVGNKPTVTNALEGMASLAGALGEATRAARLWGAAEALREVTDIALPPGEWALHEPHLAAARALLGKAAWEEALADGRAMSLDRVAEYALSKEETHPPRTVSEEPPTGEPTRELTRREREVAVLVGRGLTNRRIAQELSLSRRTVEHHVRNILKKLGLDKRSQISARAAD